jgi:hypothetical protein
MAEQDNKNQPQAGPSKDQLAKQPAKEQPRKQAVLVRSKCAHIQPGSMTYREKDEQFTHVGDLYKHVEAVKGPQPAADQDDDGGE